MVMVMMIHFMFIQIGVAMVIHGLYNAVAMIFSLAE